MTRNGKIARLPKQTRDYLNIRLQNGEPGPQLVQWLNGLPVTQDMLEDHFDSRPTNEQNLSEWRQGGYQDWLRDQQTTERVQRLAERAQDIDQASDGMSFADRLSNLLAAELADAIESLGQIADPNERWRRLQEISRELQRLRVQDHHARRRHMQEQDWRQEKEREEEEKQERAENEPKKRLLKLFWAAREVPHTAKMLGGGEAGAKWADWLFCLQNDLPMPEWWKKRPHPTSPPEQNSPNQTESNQIKPNQTESNPEPLK